MSIYVDSRSKASARSRAPSFRAQGILVLLPVLSLAVLGLSGANVGTLMAAAALALAAAGVAWYRAERSGVALGWANTITLARAGLVSVLAAALLEPTLYRDQGWIMAGLALLALALDGLDGWLARRLDECSEFGARFDMEVDAALIFVLCLGVMAADLAGPWVLLIGLMRYAFVAAAGLWPWLRASLPPSFRRKAVCVWQVAALLLALTPVVGPMVASALLLSALLALALSFALDIAWLQHSRISAV